MPTPPAKRRHPLLDGRYPEAQLYLQHRDGRWGRYVRTVRDVAKVTYPVMLTFPNGEFTWWDRDEVYASVVTARRIW